MADGIERVEGRDERRDQPRGSVEIGKEERYTHIRDRI